MLSLSVLVAVIIDWLAGEPKRGHPLVGFAALAALVVPVAQRGWGYPGGYRSARYRDLAPAKRAGAGGDLVTGVCRICLSVAASGAPSCSIHRCCAEPLWCYVEKDGAALLERANPV